MIFHSTFVQNHIDALVKEVPELTMGLGEDHDGTFVILLSHTFDDLPILARTSAFHAINDMMKSLRDAGIRARLERTYLV